MKTMMMSCVLIFSMSAIGKETILNCGKSFGRLVTLKILSSKGGFYEYQAKFKVPAKDETTGTLIRSKEYTFEGGTDTEDGVKSYLFSEVKNPTHQLFFNYVNKNNQVVEVIQLDFIKRTEKAYQCRVTSHKK